MGKIDTSEWKEFRIKDLFETQKKGNKLQVPTGASVPVQDLLEDGATPRITVTGSNNGIFGFYDYCGKNIADYRVFNNFVSVSFLGTVFYQEGDATLDMKVHCLKPNEITLNKYTGRFLVGAIRASLRESTYSDQISSSILPEMSIKLPSTPDGAPDWAYMESYMANLETKVADSLTLLQAAKNAEKKRVDTREWGEFRVGELFEKLNLRFLPNRVFDKASDISEVKSEEFNLPLVNAKHSNNGIMYYGRKHEWEYEVLTIDIVADGAASTGDVYAQPQETGVLYNAYLVKPKAKCVTGLILFFLSTVIQRCVKDHFGYDNKCTWDKVKHETILLPEDKTGQPDWAYMEEYMMEVEKKTNDALNFLDRISTRRKIDGV